MDEIDIKDFRFGDSITREFGKEAASFFNGAISVGIMPMAITPKNVKCFYTLKYGLKGIEIESSHNYLSYLIIDCVRVGKLPFNQQTPSFIKGIICNNFTGNMLDSPFLPSRVNSDLAFYHSTILVENRGIYENENEHYLIVIDPTTTQEFYPCEMIDLYKNDIDKFYHTLENIKDDDFKEMVIGKLGIDIDDLKWGLKGRYKYANI